MTDAATINRFLPCLQGFVSLLSSFPETKDKPLLPVMFREECMGVLQQFERCAIQAGIDAHDIALVQFALTAYLDERVIRDFDTPIAWLERPLQVEFYADNTAGIRFFTTLDDIKANPIRYKEVISIYYWCLELGFVGQYRTNDNPVLVEIKQTLRQQLLCLRRPAPPYTNTLDTPSPVKINSLKKKMMRRLVLVVGIGFLGLAFALKITLMLHENQVIQSLQANLSGDVS